MGFVAQLRGALGLKPDKPKKERKYPPPLKRSEMRKVSPKRAKHRASAAWKDELAHMGLVKEQPCVICGKPGPSDAHHCFSGRYGNRKVSGFETIPLCPQCHRAPYPNAIHTDKKAWEERNGPDYKFLPVVADMLAGDYTP